MSKLVLVITLMFTLGVYDCAFAGDAAVGKAIVERECAQCHKPKDWNGETPVALEALIKDAVAGKVNHSKRKLTLTPQEIADIAAYWTSNRKKS